MTDLSLRKSFATGELAAATPLEFRQLLERIRAASGLSCGQISIKTGIPRSQAYNLVSSSRMTLPRQPEQVEMFVVACGLPAMQVEIVMRLWRRLNEQRTTRNLETNNGDRGAGEDDDDEDGRNNGLLEGFRRPRTRRASRRAVREHVVADLLFLILDSEVRTRRALLLILPMVVWYLATLVVVALLVVSGSVDSTAIIPMLAALFLGPMTLFRRLARR